MSKHIVWHEQPVERNGSPHFKGYVGELHMFEVWYRPEFGWVANAFGQLETRDVWPKTAEAAKGECERALNNFLKAINAEMSPTPTTITWIPGENSNITLGYVGTKLTFMLRTGGPTARDKATNLCRPNKSTISYHSTVEGAKKAASEIVEAKAKGAK